MADHLLSNLRLVDWPAVELPPVSVVLGSTTQARLRPHFGEFDLEVLVRRRLEYEAPVMRFIEARLDRYDVVLELGTNVGVYTLLCAAGLRSLGRTAGHVIAFEPSPEAFRRLQDNIQLNDAANVRLVAAAVGSRSGLVPFFEPVGHLTNGSFDANFAAQCSDEVEQHFVPCVAGHDVIPLIPQGSRVLLKIDVEGVADADTGVSADYRDREAISGVSTVGRPRPSDARRACCVRASPTTSQTIRSGARYWLESCRICSIVMSRTICSRWMT